MRAHKLMPFFWWKSYCGLLHLWQLWTLVFLFFALSQLKILITVDHLGCLAPFCMRSQHFTHEAYVSAPRLRVHFCSGGWGAPCRLWKVKFSEMPNYSDVAAMCKWNMDWVKRCTNAEWISFRHRYWHSKKDWIRTCNHVRVESTLPQPMKLPRLFVINADAPAGISCT